MTYYPSTILETKSYGLYKSKHKRTGRVKYIVWINRWMLKSEQSEKIADLFDPFKNRQISFDQYKYNTKEEAKELLSFAILQGLLAA